MMKYIPKEEREKTRQSVKTVFSNNFYMLKLIFSASPSFVLFQAADAVRGQLSIFFEHTVLIGYVLEAAEFGYPFKKVAAAIILLFVCTAVNAYIEANCVTASAQYTAPLLTRL